MRMAFLSYLQVPQKVLGARQEFLSWETLQLWLDGEKLFSKGNSASRSRGA